MSIHNSVLRKMSKTPENKYVGEWQTVRLCPDLSANEWLNIGVYFVTKAGTHHVKMLNYFERLKCLYDNSIHEPEFVALLESIEQILISEGHESLNKHFYPYAQIEDLRYAAGESVEAILEGFYDSTVTLGKPKKKSSQRFNWVSTPTLRTAIFDSLRQTAPILADAAIQETPFLIKMKGGQQIDTRIGLVGENALGHIASAYHKSPVIIENHLLQAVSELSLAQSNGQREILTLSVLRPGENIGLTEKETWKINNTIDHHLERADKLGIEILEGKSTDEVTTKTTSRWKLLAA